MKFKNYLSPKGVIVLQAQPIFPFFVIDQLLSTETDAWQIEETLQLINPWPYKPEDLDFIGRLFRIYLSEFDWIEGDEDKE